MPRIVSIAGHSEDLIDGLKALVEKLERGDGEAIWPVTGNGAATPDLELHFSVESAEEFTEPVVDYEGE
jgi:hypothetical protein